MILCNIDPSIYEVFEITKLNKLFNIQPEEQAGMSYESNAEPIKLGYLFDFKLPDGVSRRSMRDDLMLPFELVFDDGLEQG